MIAQHSAAGFEVWLSKTRGFIHGLGLEESSDWCLDVLYLRREYARDHQEKLDYQYCREEITGVEARPAYEQLKTVSRSPPLHVSQSILY